MAVLVTFVTVAVWCARSDLIDANKLLTTTNPPLSWLVREREPLWSIIAEGSKMINDRIRSGPVLCEAENRKASRDACALPSLLH